MFGIADGSFAQYASARPGKLAPKPANLTFAQAAAVPVSALTALQAVRDRGRVQAGQKVLVIGAYTQDLQTVTELIESGQVRPVIDRTYPLSQTPEAIQYLRDGHAQGKVIVNL